MAITMMSTTFEYMFVLYILTFFVASVASFFSIRAIMTHTVIRHNIIVLCSLAVIIGLNVTMGITLAHRMSRVPRLIRSAPINKEILRHKNPSITLEFSDPVIFSRLGIHTFPESDLTIEPVGYLFNLLPIGRFLTITPKRSFPLDEPIMLYISNVEGPLTQGYGGETLLEYASETRPKILSIASPQLYTDVSVHQDIRILLDKPPEYYGVWSVFSVPDARFTVTQNQNELIFHPTSPLSQGTTYTLTFTQQPYQLDYATGEISLGNITHTENSLSFTTTQPALVKESNPRRKMIYPTEDITISFTEPMDIKDSTSIITIVPPVKFTTQWDKNNTLLTVRHDPFLKNASISAIVSKEIQTLKGGTLETDIRLDFETPGYLDIAPSSQKQTNIAVAAYTPITIQFNQPIRTSQAHTAVSVLPKFSFDTTASESSIQILPKEKLRTATQYTITIDPSVESMYGLPAQRALSTVFTTRPEQLALTVPYYKQESSFTCNIAAVRMLLAYKQIFVSEQDLIRSVGSGGKRGTGNPNIGYIDDYGTYWDAILNGISRYAKGTILHNGTIRDITSLLSSGKPVMIWGQNGWSDPHDISWTSDSGTYIKAINGMHSSVVTGFNGAPDSPTELYLNDPWRGQYKISTAEFLRRWGFFSVAMSLE